ncbi:MAG: hypothetical protein MI725_03850 [Pirellulales bacterium]|nr:hypothetical protein [Pirellulales bacterium]
MTIETLGAWGEFIGGIAVVLTLIYLAFQTRQNSKQIEQSLKLHSLAMATSHASNFQNLWRTIAEDEELADIWKRAREGAALTETEMARVEGLYMIFTLALENLTVQIENTQIGGMLGVKEADVEGTLKNIIVTYIGSEAGREWWSGEMTFGPRIRNLVDEALNSSGPSQ